MWEELPPIAFNPNYDFDYQQFLYLPREVTIFPVRLVLRRYIVHAQVWGTQFNVLLNLGGYTYFKMYLQDNQQNYSHCCEFKHAVKRINFENELIIYF